MKKRFVQLTLCTLFALLLLTALVACNDSSVAHFDCLVEFNYNVSPTVMPDSKLDSNFLGVNYGRLIQLQPSRENGEFPLGAIQGYVFKEWHLPALDAEGNIQIDEEGFVKLGDAWDFKKDKVEKGNPYIKPNEDGRDQLTLYARFEKAAQLIYVEVDKEGNEHEVSTYPGEHYEGEQVPYPMDFEQPVKTVVDENGKTIKYTFLGFYYKDPEMTQPFWTKNEKGDYDVFTVGENDVKIYVEFIEGDYKVVNEPSELLNAIKDSKDVYINADLDMTGELWAPVGCNKAIVGNNHTISNLSFTLRPTTSAYTNFGLFNRIRSHANISDLTFDNIIITFQYNDAVKNRDVRIGGFAWQIDDGAHISNVTAKINVIKQDATPAREQFVIIAESGIAYNYVTNKDDDLKLTCNVNISYLEEDN